MIPPSLASVLCIGHEATFVAAVTEAARRLGNDTILVRTVAGLPEAAAASDSAAPGSVLLVLGEPAPALVSAAWATLDSDALPRWPVVAMGRTAVPVPEVANVPPAEWNPPLLAQVFQAALTVHRLRRVQAQLKGDLATYGSRLAHDLRTPVGGILSTTEMLTEILAEERSPHAPDLQPILDSADGLVKLIERMSFFAKATASCEPPQPCDMGIAFWNAFQRIERLLLKANATLQQPAAWPTVAGHAAWLETLWGNLLLNALEHGGPAPRIEAGWNEEPDGYRFWLRSSGPARPAKPPRFFPFHRLHETGAPHGLGLAIVQRLVEREGGRCGCDASADGVCVFFSLPAPRRPAAPASTSAAT